MTTISAQGRSAHQSSPKASQLHQYTRDSYRQKPKPIGISFNDFAIAPMGVALSLVLCLLAVGCHVQPGTLPHIGGNATDAGAVAERLRTITSAGTHSESHSANLIDDRQNAQKVYEALQYAPGWVREGQANPQALAVISALQNSQQKGLNPEDYQASLWPVRLIALKAGSGSADDADVPPSDGQKSTAIALTTKET